MGVKGQRKTSLYVQKGHIKGVTTLSKMGAANDGSIAVVLPLFFNSAKSQQNSMSSPKNYLTRTKSTTSKWHFSLGNPAKIEVEIKRKAPWPTGKGLFSWPKGRKGVKATRNSSWLKDLDTTRLESIFWRHQALASLSIQTTYSQKYPSGGGGTDGSPQPTKRHPHKRADASLVWRMTPATGRCPERSPSIPASGIRRDPPYRR